MEESKGLTTSRRREEEEDAVFDRQQWDPIPDNEAALAALGEVGEDEDFDDDDADEAAGVSTTPLGASFGGHDGGGPADEESDDGSSSVEEGGESVTDALLAFFEDVGREGADLEGSLMDHLMIGQPEARVFQTLGILYAAKADTLLEVAEGPGAPGGIEGLRAKDMIVMDDFLRLRDVKRTGVYAHGIAAKLLAAYAKARLLADPSTSTALRGSVDRWWDRPCSPGPMMALCEGATASQRLAETAKLGRDWLTALQVLFEDLAGAGFTNGQLVCLRGESIDTATGTVDLPILRPGQEMKQGAHMNLACPLVDDMFSRAKILHDKRAAAAAAASGGKGRVTGGAAEGGGGEGAAGAATQALTSAVEAATAAAAAASAAATAATTVASTATAAGASNKARALSTESAPLRTGSALAGGPGRAQIGPVHEELGAAIAGVHGALQSGVFGLDKDRIESNGNIARWFRTYPHVVRAHVKAHPHALITIGVHGGKQQSLVAFAARLGDDEGPITTGLKQAAASCVVKDDDDPARDTSADISLLPPSARVYGLAMQALVDSTLPESLLTDPRIVKELEEELGVASAFVRKKGDPGLAFTTILNSCKDVARWSKVSFGTAVYVPGDLEMFPREYARRHAIESRSVSQSIKALRENSRAKKDAQARALLGPNEIFSTLEKAWANRACGKIREASAVLSLLSACSGRVGIVTGFHPQDFRFDIPLVLTEVSMPDGGTAKVKRRALRTTMSIYTSKNGVVSSRGREAGASAFDRQDRTSGVVAKFVDISALELPGFLCPGMQILLLFEVLGYLELSAAECLRQERFPLAHHPFVRGADCDCDVDRRNQVPEPTLEAWSATHARLKRDDDGFPIVCDRCGKVDKTGKHSPDEIRALRGKRAFPRASCSSAVNRFFKDVLRTCGGLAVHGVSVHSSRRANVRLAARVSRDLGISVVGHLDRSVTDVYYAPHARQGEGGYQLTVDFVSKTGVRGAEHDLSGDVIGTYVSPETFAASAEDIESMGRKLGLCGSMRYCRLPQRIRDAFANSPVVAEAEARASEDIQRLAEGLDSLDGEETQGTDDAGMMIEGAKFTSVDVTKQGWASEMLEMARSRFGRESDDMKSAEQTVLAMERRVKDVVNAEDVLMDGVSKSIFRQLAEDAKVAYQRAEEEAAGTEGSSEPTTITGRLRADHMRTVRREGGLQELVRGHVASLIDSVEGRTAKRLREEAAAAAKAAETAFRRKLSAAEASARAAAKSRNAEPARQAEGVEGGPAAATEVRPHPPFTATETRRMFTHPSALGSFNSHKNNLARGGRGWVSANTRTSSKATGGAVGRPAGHAQIQLPAEQERSVSGVSTLRGGDGVPFLGFECPEAECRAAFRPGVHVLRVIKEHARKTHQVSSEKLKGLGYVSRFLCECPECAGEESGRGKRVDPKTWLQHREKMNRPSHQEEARMLLAKKYAGLASEYARAVDRVRDSGRGALPEDVVVQMSASMAALKAEEPRFSREFGLAVPGGALSQPVNVDLAILTVKGVLTTRWACAKRCKDYLDADSGSAGLLKSSTFRDHHQEKQDSRKGQCLPEGMDTTFRRCVLPTCRPTRGRFFTTQALDKHITSDHKGGLRGLVTLLSDETADKEAGTMAILPRAYLQKMGDPWTLREGAAKRSLGNSPFNEADPGTEVYFLSSQVVHDGKGNIVVEPGFVLEDSPAARLAGAAATPAPAAETRRGQSPRASSGTSGRGKGKGKPEGKGKGKGTGRGKGRGKGKGKTPAGQVNRRPATGSDGGGGAAAETTAGKATAAAGAARHLPPAARRPEAGGGSGGGDGGDGEGGSSQESDPWSAAVKRGIMSRRNPPPAPSTAGVAQDQVGRPSDSSGSTVRRSGARPADTSTSGHAPVAPRKAAAGRRGGGSDSGEGGSSQDSDPWSAAVKRGILDRRDATTSEAGMVRDPVRGRDARPSPSPATKAKSAEHTGGGRAEPHAAGGSGDVEVISIISDSSSGDGDGDDGGGGGGDAPAATPPPAAAGGGRRVASAVGGSRRGGATGDDRVRGPGRPGDRMAAASPGVLPPSGRQARHGAGRGGAARGQGDREAKRNKEKKRRRSALSLQRPRTSVATTPPTPPTPPAAAAAAASPVPGSPQGRLRGSTRRSFAASPVRGARGPSSPATGRVGSPEVRRALNHPAAAPGTPKRSFQDASHSSPPFQPPRRKPA